jgi:hypothetical protein
MCPRLILAGGLDLTPAWGSHIPTEDLTNILISSKNILENYLHLNSVSSEIPSEPSPIYHTTLAISMPFLPKSLIGHDNSKFRWNPFSFLGLLDTKNNHIGKKAYLQTFGQVFGRKQSGRSAVGTSTGFWAEPQRSRCPRPGRIRNVHYSSTPAVRPTEPPTRWILRIISPGDNEVGA